MQRCFLKILLILLGPVFLLELSALGQISTHRLQQADSLFQSKLYTQSMEHYRSIFDQQQYTPAMLLKMAYIEEGLNQTGQALYYLNLYYDVTNDNATFEKMEELAAKFNLEGYEQTDKVRALSFYYDYYATITLGFASIAFILLVMAIYLKARKQKPLVPVIILQLVLILMLVHVNVGEKASLGIISTPNTYIMDGPSSGASVVSIIDAGHRVEIVGRNDVWVKILWQGKVVYIKEHNLLPMTL